MPLLSYLNPALQSSPPSMQGSVQTSCAPLLLRTSVLLSPFSFLLSPFLSMSCLQVILCLVFPPLAVIDRGCGSVIIVTLLCLCGWVPGVLAALIILNRN